MADDGGGSGDGAGAGDGGAVLGIGEVAERTGLSVDALRFYERERLLVEPVRRSAGGRRRYSAFDVEWLRICVKLRESGMPLAELRHFAELVRRGPGNEAERLRLLDAHQRRVDERIRVLEECRSVIAWKTAVYAEHLARGEATGLWDPTVRPGRPPAPGAPGPLGAPEAPGTPGPPEAPEEPAEPERWTAGDPASAFAPETAGR